MEVHMESKGAQEGPASKFNTFSELCDVISLKIDRGNSSHQIFIRFLDSILYDIKAETQRNSSKDTGRVIDTQKLVKKMICRAVLSDYSEFREMVQEALSEILQEGSEFKKNLENEWLPQIIEIFKVAVRDELKDNVEFKGKEEKEWLTPLISFLCEPCDEERKTPKVTISMPRLRQEELSSDTHHKVPVPFSPRETPISPIKQDQGMSAKYDLTKEVDSIEQDRRVQKSSYEFRNSSYKRSSMIKSHTPTPPSSPIRIEKNQPRSKELPESKKNPRRTSLPVKISNFFQRKGRGPKDDGPSGSAAGSSCSL